MAIVKYNVSRLEAYREELLNIGESLDDIYEAISSRTRKMDSSQRSIKNIKDSLFYLSNDISRDGNQISTLGSYIGDCAEEYRVCDNKVNSILNGVENEEKAPKAVKDPILGGMLTFTDFLNSDSEFIKAMKKLGYYDEIKDYYDVFAASFFTVNGFVTENPYGCLYGIFYGMNEVIEHGPEIVAAYFGVPEPVAETFMNFGGTMVDVGVDIGYNVVKGAAKLIGIDYDKVLINLTGSAGRKGVDKMFDQVYDGLANVIVDGAAKAVTDVRSFFGKVSSIFG